MFVANMFVTSQPGSVPAMDDVQGASIGFSGSVSPSPTRASPALRRRAEVALDRLGGGLVVPPPGHLRLGEPRAQQRDVGDRHPAAR
jgi:hypothetical protein